MSSYSSLSSVSASPSPTLSHYHEDGGLFRTRSLHSGTSASHQIGQSAGRGSGSRVRYLDLGHQEALRASSKARNGLSRIRTPPGERGYREDQDGRHIAIQRDDNDRRGPIFRTQSDAHNEAGASRALRSSGRLRPQTSAIQAHQTYHADGGCNSNNTARRPSLPSPISTVSFSPSTSLLSRSPSIPSTPHRQHSSACVVGRKSYAYLPHSPSLSSLASTGPPALSLAPPFEEPSTPSPSPHSQRTRSHRSTSPPPSFIIRRGLAVQRAPPTLAMSIQIHAPSPIMSVRSLSPPPVPSSSARARSRSRRPESRSRPTSPLSQPAQLPGPQRPPMARPPSRSERLLRDTLRRAEEHDRMLNVHPLPSPKVSGGSLPGSPFLAPTGTLPLMGNGTVPMSPTSSRRHSRKNTASSIASNVSCDACDHLYEAPGSVVGQDHRLDDMEENKGWSWRNQSGPSASSSSSGHGYAQGHGHTYQYQPTTTTTPPGLSRNRSMTHPSRGDTPGRANSDSNTKAQIAYGTPQSPSPTRTQLQRSATTMSAAGRSSPRGGSFSQPTPPTHSHSNSRASFDGERSAYSQQQGTMVTPHEAVLRSRLEGVLRGVKEQERREKSSERRYKEVGSSSGSGSGSGNSMASSRNMSAEGDVFFGASGESSVTSLSSVDSRPSGTATAKNRASFSSVRPQPATLNFPARSPPTSNAPLRSPSTPNKALGSPGSSHNGISPLTPPPTPPFNARTAAEQCRAMDGYVSFANIEGLGVPEGEDDDDIEGEDGKGRGRWWQWLTITSGKTGSKIRGRSDSASSAVSR